MEPTTCGQGIAENSGLPAKLAELIAAIGAVLEHHTKALDPADPESRPEFDAYIDLMQQHREVSDQLSRLAERMAGYNDLPMARHDVAELGNSKAIAVFSALIRQEDILVALLQQRLNSHRSMLKTMTEADSATS